MDTKQIKAWLACWCVADDLALSKVASIEHVGFSKGVCTLALKVHWYGTDAWQQRLKEDLCAAFSTIESVQMTIEIVVQTHAVKKPLSPISGIKNIIAVGSGKGGVGKSTVSVLLALSLAKMGAKVGLLDADIHGPNQPALLDAEGRSLQVKEGKMQPVLCHGIATMSMHYLLSTKEDPIVWRGPMVSKGLMQMAVATNWGELDYLLVDLPPGTGDVQLTLAQKLPLTAAVMVTTPQMLACLDTAKGVSMLQSMDVPVLGILENMASVQCAACGHVDALWGEAGGAALAEHCQLPLLGRWSIQKSMAAALDIGRWFDDNSGRIDCMQSAEALSLYCAALPRFIKARIPPVVVESRRK